MKTILFILIMVSLVFPQTDASEYKNKTAEQLSGITSGTTNIASKDYWTTNAYEQIRVLYEMMIGDSTFADPYERGLYDLMFGDPTLTGLDSVGVYEHVGNMKVYNVKDYGNNFTAFQTIADSMPSTGAVIVIPEDIDLSSATDTIAFTKPVVMRGNDITLTGNDSLVFFDFRDHVYMDGITFNNFKYPILIYNIGDSLLGGSNKQVVIDKVNFKNCFRPIWGQMSATNSSGNGIKSLIVTNTTTDSCAAFVWFRYLPVDLFVAENNVHKNSYVASDNSYWTAGTTLILYSIGYYPENEELNTTSIINNVKIDTVINNYTGSRIYGIINYRSGGMTVSNSFFRYFYCDTSETPSNAAIYLRSSTEKIYNCEFYDAGEKAIYIKGVEGHKYIYNNYFHTTDSYRTLLGATIYGIYMGTGTSSCDVFVEGNYFENNTIGFLSKSRESKKLEIINNRFKDIATAGINIIGSDPTGVVTIKENKFYSNTSYDILIQKQVFIAESYNIENNEFYPDSTKASLIYFSGRPKVTNVINNRAYLLRDTVAQQSTYGMSRFLFYAATAGYWVTSDTADIDSSLFRLVVKDNIIQSGNGSTNAIYVSGRLEDLWIQNNYIDNYNYVYQQINYVKNLNISNNRFINIQNTGIITVPTDSVSSIVVKNNSGDAVTENRGTVSTIALTKYVDHGLMSLTGQNKYIYLTPKTLLPDTVNYAVTDIGASEFTLSINYLPSFSEGSGLIYGDSTTPGSPVSYAQDIIYYFRVAITDTIKIDSIGVYIGTSNTATHVKGAIYNNSSNNPTSLIDTTSEISGSPIGSSQTVYLEFTAKPNLLPGTYWIALWADGGSFRHARGGDAGETVWRWQTETYGIWPTTADNPTAGTGVYNDIDVWINGVEVTTTPFEFYWRGETLQ